MSTEYPPVTPEIVDGLRQIVGGDGVHTDPGDTEKYSCDEMPVPKPRFPEVVVRPRDTTAVAGILALASDMRLPVTPRGAGTGVSGGCVPLFGGILLSLERMNRILEIDTDNQVAVVEAGVALAELYSQVEQHGLYYPCYPGESSATIGGNLATNAGGMRAVKYGVTRNHVLGLEAVLASGSILSVGGKFVKSSTGYDLTQLLVGSEGTLAVITKAILRLVHPPQVREVLFVPFADLRDAIRAVPDILKSGAAPTGIEFMEKDIIDVAREHAGMEFPFSDSAAFLMVILEGQKPEEVYQAASAIEAVCMGHGAVGVYLPPGEASKRRLLEARERFYPTLKGLGPLEVADIVVPRSRIPDFIEGVREISRSCSVPVVAYGHAGDGNVHLHLLGKGIDPGEWKIRLARAFEAIYSLGTSLGGAISGEHGLGFEKAKYLPAHMDREAVALMRAIKAAFDPKRILNPGKVLPLD